MIKLGKCALNLAGTRYGFVEALEPVGRKNRSIVWKCRCHRCGRNDYTVTAQLLRHGKITSCGCYNKEANPGNTTHGYSNTPTYTSWKKMKARCSNPNDEAYAYYGGRGITYDPRWEVFENFLADMGERPYDMELDRYPDNDGNYCKENCRWATHRDNCNNRREHYGKKP